MPIEDDVLALIRGSIRSTRALELLLQRDRGREWNEAELVRELRGSPLIVRDGLTALQAAGAVRGQPDLVRYYPCTDRIADLVERLVRSYEQRPAAVHEGDRRSPGASGSPHLKMNSTEKHRSVAALPSCSQAIEHQSCTSMCSSERTTATS